MPDAHAVAYTADLMDLISGERAVEQADFLYQSDHWFTYTNFARTAQHVAQRLEWMGMADVRVDPIPAENRTRYSGWTTMTAWDVDHARLTVVGPPRRVLADWAQTPHHLIMRSESARGLFPAVQWDGDPAADLRGKIAFTHQRAAEVQHALRAAGGTGIISDFLPSLPGVRDARDARDHVLWEQVCFRPNPGNLFGFMLSPQQGQWLEEQLRGGPLEMEVDVQARNHEGVTHAVDALIPADDPCAQDLLLVAHLYEPGANDNASGAALALEVLAAIIKLRRRGRLRLRRGIRVLLAYEGRGTVAWMHRHAPDLRRLVAGLNLDEIGVDQAIGKSTAHVFLPPHSAPSIAGDVLVHCCQTLLPPEVRWKPVGDRADIILDTRFSDPNIGVPTPCIIQYPAFTYHTSKDTPAVLSPRVMKAFGVVAAAYLLRMANLGPADADELDALASADAWRQRQAVTDPRRLGLLRERLEWKRRELGRLGVGELPRLERIINNLPAVKRATGRYAALVPRRCTLASPGGTQVADLLPDSQRTAFRKNLLEHGLDLVFHHLFYWADGSRSVEDICLRIEDELALSANADAIPRTTTGQLTHDLEGRLDREAVMLLYEQLVEIGMMRIAAPGGK